MIKELLLGYDIGSSSIKASFLEAKTGKLIASAVSPQTEMKIDSPREGWAEQHPDTWWQHVILATQNLLKQLNDEDFEVLGIGISYQMHGLVMVDKYHHVIHPSIIWCDSRAVEIGRKALSDLGESYCLGRCLNFPGNFTASKLKWVKENKPDIYSRIYKVMLPGDFIAMKLTDQIFTTISGLSEGIFWDFKEKKIAEELVNYYGLERSFLAEIVPAFSPQGSLTAEAAKQLGLKPGIPISYRAGDQPNNALSLNVLNSGEIAATAGTSGVIYGVVDKNLYDLQSRVNTFAHVNYSNDLPNVGILLCINGTGIFYSWLKQVIFENKYSYIQMNDLAALVSPGSQGVLSFPFGNGAERVLGNRDLGANFLGINFNIHNKSHIIRSAQEGIAFTFKYGLDVMKNIGLENNVVRAGNSNLFLSNVFREAFVNVCNIQLEIYNTDGSQGAARGAGIGIGYYTEKSAFKNLFVIESLSPQQELVEIYESAYRHWKSKLDMMLGN